MTDTKVYPPHIDPVVIVQTQVQAGLIIPFAGSTIPTGFLLCDGTAISRTTFATLFGVIGVTWGVGDGSTTFNIPDCRGRTPFGKATSGTFLTMGSNGGSETHSHTAASHIHSVSSHNHNGPSHGHTTTSDGSHTHSGGGAGGLLSVAGAVGTDTQGAHTHTVSSTAISSSSPDLSTTSDPTTVGTSTDSAANPYIVLNYLIKV